MARISTLKPHVQLLDPLLKPVESPSERRIRGRRLQAERRRLFRDSPLCALCEKRGIVRVAVERDHIVPLHKGGADTAENTQGLCKECHQIKTAYERRHETAMGGSSMGGMCGAQL
jgi:5-methylcytosine-specific restriction protein A